MILALQLGPVASYVFLAVLIAIPIAFVLRLPKMIGAFRGGYVKGRIERMKRDGFTESEIYANVSRPGIAAQYPMIVAGIGLLILALFVPITWPLFLLFCIRLYQNAKRQREETALYEQQRQREIARLRAEESQRVEHPAR